MSLPWAVQKPITILSIDGGGVRGIIPAVLLDFLESELQKLENNPDVRLADYFDVISGTSTGGLITTMISTPDEKGRPKYAARELVPFYKEHCPKIFPRSGNWSEENKTLAGEIQMKYSEHYNYEGTSVLEESICEAKFEEGKGLKKPSYDGKYLHKLAKHLLGDKRLRDTLTKVVIPAYDVKKLSPVIFSSFEVENGNKALDALLSDICISTSAAPVYLPAYKFSNEGVEFNMIDGGVAANNPTVAAITEAVKRRSEEIDKDAKVDLNSFYLVVLSLGTCENKSQKYNVDLVNSFWSINWLIYPLKKFWKADHPILEILFEASSDMADYYCTMFFEAFRRPENILNIPENFLRIQDDKLPKELAALDNGTPDNLNKLEQYAKNLLNRTITRIIPGTFERSEVDSAETYGEALKKFAKQLFDIKHNPIFDGKKP